MKNLQPEQRNLFIAIGISLVILVASQFLLPRHETPAPAPTDATTASSTATGDQARPALPGAEADLKVRSREAVLADNPARVAIHNGRLDGTLNTVGARLDDLSLVDYRETVDPKSPEISLFSPAGTIKPYYAEWGWVADKDTPTAVPTSTTQWTASSDKLSPDSPVTLSWDNGEGVTFEQTVSVDKNFMFSVDRKVINNSGKALKLFPYGLVSRKGKPEGQSFYIVHEGPYALVDGTLKDYTYKKMDDAGSESFESTGGWVGLTDKYWMATLVPDQKEAVQTTMRHASVDGDDRYQVQYLGSAHEVAPGASLDIQSHLFAGAKEVKLIQSYEDKLGIDKFELTVDFGWFKFLTKPLFLVILWIYGLVGNFGIAIICLTILVRLLMFPLAQTSFRTMTKMKKLGPQMKAMREKYADDKAAMNAELMKVYQKEKVNPVAGCLPVLVQIPVFFSLYKVFFVSIEMRHAPFFGWIHDLSAPDPTSIFNLFGLIPWTPPHALMIGVWPLIMGFTMFVQQRLNPPPADPVQAKMFLALPFVFTFMLSSFPAGLVLYYSVNNTLSASQQYLMMRRLGVAVDAEDQPATPAKPEKPARKTAAKAETTTRRGRAK
ncbi:membrane protein insertase YidC [Radicibacter daui]|uniref:membrane protein insertase YidC n=1 Tax=Radicibacter daui TaxID=3064829 RepID=UPI004046EB05